MGLREVAEQIRADKVELIPPSRLDELQAWAGLFGRRVIDEVLIAIDLHLLNHALAILDDEGVQDEIKSEELKVDDIERRLRERVESRRSDAYTRPSPAQLVMAKYSEAAEDPEGFPGFTRSRQGHNHGT